jgi:hypothetical protein
MKPLVTENVTIFPNRICNNLQLLVPSLLSNRSCIVDLVTMEMCTAKYAEESGHIASEIR